MTKLRRFDLNWILVPLLAIIAIAPLTYPGFFQAQSGFLPAYNAAHPVQAPNYGRPAASLRGEGKLPYLLAWPFFKLSSSGVIAVRWGYGLAFLLAALASYAWARRWLGARGGVLTAAVYTYLPWHLSAVYVRGAFAEAWLWAFFPLLLWAADLLAERRRRSALVAAAVGLPAMAASACALPGVAALFVPIVAAYGVTVGARRRHLALSLLPVLLMSFALLWVLGGSAFPASASFVDHFLVPYQLLSPAWGWGRSVSGWADEMSFQLGVAAVGLVLLALAFRRSSGQHTPDGPPPHERAFWFWVVTLVVVVLLTLPVSAWLWRAGRLEGLVTYPWQVLALAGLPLAFLAGSAIRLERQLANLPVWSATLAVVVLASYPYLAPRFTQVSAGTEPVALFQPVEAEAPQILLVDDQIVSPTELTPTLTLSLTWQAIAPVSGDYTVFAHLLAADDTKVAQLDTRPCSGSCPTDTWQPGEIIVDQLQLALIPDTPPGPYRLGVGLYLLDSGKRAAVLGRDDSTVYFNVP